MKIIITAITAAIVALVSVAAVSAAPPGTGKNSITCFGDPASCTVVNKTTVRLDTTGTKGGAGAYIPGFNSSFYGVRTNAVSNLSNTVTGSPLGIDPRWSIPIDDRDVDYNGGLGAGYTDYFLFASFADCNNGSGLVDVVNDPTCTLYNSVTGESFANWSEFIVEHENTYIALNDNYAFIIADESGPEGVWTISNMKVGKPGK